jgi:hypothetical protein
MLKLLVPFFLFLSLSNLHHLENMATCTANGRISYDNEYLGKPLREWVREVHRDLTHSQDWEYKPLLPGAFGFDNLALPIATVLGRCDLPLQTDAIAEVVHNSWADNYCFWRDQLPWICLNNYMQPYNELGDDRRDRLAELQYHELPEGEKIKDQIVADSILNILQTNLNLYEG